MFRHIGRSVAAALLLSLALPGGAHANTPRVGGETVFILHLVYFPEEITIGVGEFITWVNTMDMPMTATCDGVRDGSHSRRRVGVFDSGMIDPQGEYTFTFFAAGEYSYHNTMAPAQTGSVTVGLRTAPNEGPAGTRFRIIVGSRDAPAGFAYDVQIKEPGGTFHDWQIGVTEGTLGFDSRGAAPGTYSFRSRLHRLGSDTTTGWSLERAVTVT